MTRALLETYIFPGLPRDFVSRNDALIVPPHKAIIMTITKNSLFIFLVFSMIVLFMGLGQWQLKRLTWKQDLLRTRQEALHREPTDLIPQQLEPHEIRKVNLRGTLLSPFVRLYVQGSYQRVHPFELENGHILYVILGTENQSSPPIALKKDKSLTNFTVLLHHPSKANTFTPVNNPEKQQWYHLYLSDLDATFGKEGLPFLATALSSVAPHILPLDIDRFLSLPNNHLLYAITWFSLAFVLGVLLLFFISRGTKDARLPKA